MPPRLQPAAAPLGFIGQLAPMQSEMAFAEHRFERNLLDFLRIVGVVRDLYDDKVLFPLPRLDGRPFGIGEFFRVPAAVRMGHHKISILAIDG